MRWRNDCRCRIPAADVTVMGPNERKGNLIARIAVSGQDAAADLIIGHLDVSKRGPRTGPPIRFNSSRRTALLWTRQADMKTMAIIGHRFHSTESRSGSYRIGTSSSRSPRRRGGTSNGVDWLLKNHRDLIDAEYVLNTEATGVVTDHGKPLTVEVVATENCTAITRSWPPIRGGHSSLPKPDNAIYHVATRSPLWRKHRSCSQLNSVTGNTSRRWPRHERPTAADMRAMRHAADAAAIARLSQDARYNAPCAPLRRDHDGRGMRRTRCPSEPKPTSTAVFFPGITRRDRLQLVAIFNDPTLTVVPRRWRELSDHGSDRKAMPPPPLRTDVMDTLRQRGRKVSGRVRRSSDHDDVGLDSAHTMMAGIRYGISGLRSIGTTFACTQGRAREHRVI